MSAVLSPQEAELARPSDEAQIGQIEFPEPSYEDDDTTWGEDADKAGAETYQRFFEGRP